MSKKKKLSKEEIENKFWEKQLPSAMQLNMDIRKDRRYYVSPEENKVKMCLFIYAKGYDYPFIFRDIETITASKTNDIYITGRDGALATILPSGYGSIGDSYVKIEDAQIMLEHEEFGILNNKKMRDALAKETKIQTGK